MTLLVAGQEKLTSHIRIEPSKGFVSIKFGKLWEDRELFYFLIWRDIKIRYKQMALGGSWAVIQPLMTMIIFSIFFRQTW